MAFEPHWTTYLSSLLTPVIAAIGLFIAYWQWKTAKDKLKSDLFDRRYSVFESTRVLCESVWLRDPNYKSNLAKLRLTPLEAKWLFNERVAKYIRDLHQKAVELDLLNLELENFIEKYPISRYYSSKLADVPQPDRERILACRKSKDELVDWFSSQESAFDELFSPFLSLRH